MLTSGCEADWAEARDVSRSDVSPNDAEGGPAGAERACCYARIDCRAAVSLSYLCHTPKASSFSCPAVYQPGPEAEDAEDAGERTEEPHRKRKRRKTKAHCEGAQSAHHQSNPALISAAARHKAVENRLLQAWESYRREKAAHSDPALEASGDSRPKEGVFGTVPGECHEEVMRLEGDETNQEEIDFVALEAMRRTLYPKLQFLSSGKEVNLFDSVVSCPRGVSAEETEEEQEAIVMGSPYLLPPRCSFLMSDITRMRPLVAEARRRRGFHLVVVDPPWENASARRSGVYQTLPNRTLLGLPLQDLLAPSGQSPLVALWLTNREKLRRFVEEELLPAWGLRQVAVWHWLKVTDGGDTVTSLSSEHRRPYEPLLLARRAITDQAQDGPKVPSLTMISTPGPHSRKPRVGGLLRPYLGCPDDGDEEAGRPRCLELFARELEAGWTSWGNEPLKFQHSKFFDAAAAPRSPP